MNTPPSNSKPLPEMVTILRKYILFTEGLLSLFLNLAVLLVVLYRRSLLYNASGLFVVMLSLVDMANSSSTLYGNIRFFLGIFGSTLEDCQIRGGTTCFFIFSSTWLVGMLAYSRYDTVISSQTGRAKPWWYWIFIGGLPMLMFLILCIVLGANYKFYQAPIGRCMIIDPHHEDGLRMFTQIFSLIISIATLVTVTFCYISIANTHRKVVKKMPAIQLSQTSQHSVYHQEMSDELDVGETKTKFDFRKMTRKVFIKICVMLSFYYVCLIPSIGLEIYELASWQVRSIEADAVSAALLLLLGSMNALMVLVLHEQIKLTMIEILLKLRFAIFRR